MLPHLHSHLKLMFTFETIEYYNPCRELLSLAFVWAILLLYLFMEQRSDKFSLHFCFMIPTQKKKQSNNGFLSIQDVPFKIIMKLWLDLKLFVQYWTWKNVIEQLVSVSWFRSGYFLRIRVLQTSANWDNQLKPSNQVGNTLQYHVCFKRVHKSCKHTTLRLYHTAHDSFYSDEQRIWL